MRPQILIDRLKTLRGGGLRARMIQAAGLTTMAYFVSQILRLGSNLILARMLSPDMFGVMSIVIIVQVLLLQLSDIGLRVVVIQSERGDEPIFLNTVWTIQAIRGVLIWLSASLVAAGFYFAGVLGYLSRDTAIGSTVLPAALAVSATAAIFQGLQSTRLLTYARQMNVRPLVAVEFLNQIAGLMMVLILAYFTRSIWSLVVGGVISAIVLMVLSHTWGDGIRNRFMLEREAKDEIARKGVWVMVSSTVSALAANADRMMLSGLVSAAVLGIYSIALSFCQLVEQVGSRLYESIALTSLSEVARTDPTRFRSVFLKLKLAFDTWFAGAAGFVFAISPKLVETLYDHRYHDAGWMLQILSFSILIARVGLYNAAYLSLGITKYPAMMNLLRLISCLMLFSVGYYFFGLPGGLVGLACQSLPLMPVYLYLNHKHGLNNWLVELGTLAAWPVGYAGGVLASRIVTMLIG